MSSSVIRKAALSLVVCCTLLLVGCDKVKGVYSEDTGTMSINFKGGGKADVTVAGMTKETTYEVDGDKVTLHSPEKSGKDNIVLTINSDGTLDGGKNFPKFKKKE